MDTLPSPDNITTYTTALQERIARDIMGDYIAYRSAVLAEGSVEDHRKLVEVQLRVTAAELKRQADPHAGLTTFNITFSSSNAPTVFGGSPLPIEVLAVEVPDPQQDAQRQDARPPTGGARPTHRVIDIDLPPLPSTLPPQRRESDTILDGLDL
jgi:hypothetical protein